MSCINDTCFVDFFILHLGFVLRMTHSEMVKRLNNNTYDREKARNASQTHKVSFIMVCFLRDKSEITSSPSVLQPFLLILLGRKEVGVI